MNGLAAGAAWMVGMRWVLKAIGLLNTAILARVLLPADFGIMAMAMVVVELAIVLTDGDYEVAVVRARQAGRDLYDTAWTARLLAGGLAGLLVLAAAAPAAHLFEDPRVATFMAIAALRPVILGFENIGTVDFRRDLDFAREFRYLVAQRVLGLGAGLALVMWLGDWHALAWSGPAAAAATVLLSFVLSPYRPRASLARWRDIAAFSRWLVLFNLTRSLNERVDVLMVGRLADAAAAGGYYVAFDVATMPTREMALPAGRGLLPNLARLGDEPAGLRRAVALVLGAAAILCLPMGAGLALVARDLLPVFLGPQWAHMVPLFQLAALYAALEGLWLILDPLLIATGRERMLAAANLALSAVLVPVIVLTALGAGWQWIPLARMAVMGVALAWILGRLVAWGWIGWGGVAGVLWRPVLAVASMAMVVEAARLPEAAGPVLGLAWSVCLGGATFALVLAMLWWGAGRPDGAEAALMAWARHRPGARIVAGRQVAQSLEAHPPKES